MQQELDFPRDRMMYVTFGAAEEDMYPAGDSAIGTYAVANALPGDDFPLVAALKNKYMELVKETLLTKAELDLFTGTVDLAQLLCGLRL